MKSFFIFKLGCPKNDVDADYIAGFLISEGLRETKHPDKADLLIVNSCGFIESAKEESIEAILMLAQLKETNPNKRLILTGCLSQRYARELEGQIPELDGIFGIENVADIIKLLNNSKLVSVSPIDYRHHYLRYNCNRSINRQEPFAYLKISDGCDNRCSYCAIPYIRGPLRSRPMTEIIEEAKYLLDNGKRELILVSQEATAYGKDLYGKPRLFSLLERLTKIVQTAWVRVMYLHPARLEKDLIDYMVDNPAICAYFDLPLQHVDDRILRRMKRRVTHRQIEDILNYIRDRKAKTAIRTTFIVGFPGEDAVAFEKLSHFVEEWHFERMGCFAYSREEDTPAAVLPRQVKDNVKQNRLDKLMVLQQKIAFDNNSAAIGSRIEVLVDAVNVSNGIAIGRSRFDAPEIDQTVKFSSNGVKPGDFVTVTISGADGYDLLGERGKV